MENLTNKSFETKITVDNKEHSIKGLIITIPKETEIENIDTEANKGFIYTVTLSIQPDLPKETYDSSKKNLVFAVGIGDDQRLGYLQGNKFIQLEDSVFVTALHATFFEVLAVVGDTGHFKV